MAISKSPKVRPASKPPPAHAPRAKPPPGPRDSSASPAAPATVSPPAKLLGRPVLPEDQRRGVLLRVSVTEAEHERLKVAANRTGLPLSAWLRQLALKALEHIDKP